MRVYVTLTEETGQPRRLKVFFANKKPKWLKGTYWTSLVRSGLALNIEVYAAGATSIGFAQPKPRKKAAK
jgi:hypothetical protein